MLCACLFSQISKSLQLFLFFAVSTEQLNMCFLSRSCSHAQNACNLPSFQKWYDLLNQTGKQAHNIFAIRSRMQEKVETKPIFCNAFCTLSSVLFMLKRFKKLATLFIFILSYRVSFQHVHRSFYQNVVTHKIATINYCTKL